MQVAGACGDSDGLLLRTVCSRAGLDSRGREESLPRRVDDVNHRALLGDREHAERRVGRLVTASECGGGGVGAVSTQRPWR